MQNLQGSEWQTGEAMVPGHRQSCMRVALSRQEGPLSELLSLTPRGHQGRLLLLMMSPPGPLPWPACGHVVTAPWPMGSPREGSQVMMEGQPLPLEALTVPWWRLGPWDD